MTTEGIGIVRLVKLEDEMRSSYLDYAMSVIVARALPDARDGLKPVHRRILYAMDELGVRPGTPYKKSARIVGEVLGKYHPHGDAPVYDALVRMAQSFSMRYPLIDGQGNFGSVDNDPPAAMRYTEARLAQIATEMLVDIDQDTVDFTANFDNSLREPMVLPARLPNLLVNGSSGIAVGMATNIPPHNLTEICNAIIRMIDEPDISIDDLLLIVKGPDFPTAGIIMGREGITSAYHTGRGKIVVRGKVEIEDMKGGRERIVVTELPYQINKASLIEKIADLIKEKRIDGISDIRDESDRQGMRMVLELRRDAMSSQVLNNLYQHTALQSSFHVNMLALVDGQPRVLNLRQALRQYIDFRVDVVTRRSRYQLLKARERDHILLGLIKALDQLDAVISTIRGSDDAEDARTRLMTGFSLTQVQAQAILDMQLRRLAALERQKILDEHDELTIKIAYLVDLLSDKAKILAVVKTETGTLLHDFGDKRMSEISGDEARGFTDEDLIPPQDVVVSISSRNYAKRLPVDAYRIQRRGGRGVQGMITRAEDIVQHLLTADTHDHLLFFTNRGRVLHSKCFRIPQEQTRTAKGTPLVNLIPLVPDELVTAVVATKDFEHDQYLMLVTRNGKVKRTLLKEFAFVISRVGGIIAMNLLGDDELVAARIVEEKDHVVVATEQGKAMRFAVSDARPIGRAAEGVRGIRIPDSDRVVGMEKMREGHFVLVVSEKGQGKLTRVERYPVHKRGGMGVKTLNITEKTGPVTAVRVVAPEQEMMIISKGGIMLRTTVQQIRVTGRSAQGVRVINLEEDDTVASIATFDSKPEGPSGTNGTNGTKPTAPAAEGAGAATDIDDADGELEVLDDTDGPLEEMADDGEPEEES